MQELHDRTLRELHGEALDELRELEAGIESCHLAVEAGREEIAHTAEVFDKRRFDELAAPVERSAAFIPWLAKYGDKIKTHPVDPENPKAHSLRDATPEEIEAGQYFPDLRSYQRANGVAA
jgi:hypothetical protein